MGKTSQVKGRRGERELAEVLKTAGIPAEVGYPVSFGTIPDVVGVPGVHVEVKRVERLNIDAAIDQAVRDAEKFRDGVPAVFHRKNRRGWLVTMNLQDWLQMYKRGKAND